MLPALPEFNDLAGLIINALVDLVDLPDQLVNILVVLPNLVVQFIQLPQHFADLTLAEDTLAVPHFVVFSR